MHKSFGLIFEPSSTKWSDVRKGPSLDAVREHISRVTTYTSRIASSQSSR